MTCFLATKWKGSFPLSQRGADSGRAARLSDFQEVSLWKQSICVLAYGYALDVKEEATERKLITSADGYTDEETTNAHNFIVWNIRTLEKQDILALARQVSALSSYTYSTKMFMKKAVSGEE